MSDKKRTYVKRDTDYWGSRGQASRVSVPEAPVHPTVPFPEIKYGATDIATASREDGPPTAYRPSQKNSAFEDANSFQNIRAMAMPYTGFNGNRSYAGMRDAIDLCVKAWTGIPVVRNAIEVSVEFSAQPIYFKSENQTVLTFFTEWWKIIGGPKLVEQCMREYYRSGNPFLLPFYGKFGPSYYKNFQQSFGAKENRIPIRYELLNPTNVFVPTGVTSDYTYCRLLSTYEIERLKNPMTEQDRQVFEDLPKETKQQIRSGGSSSLGIYMPLDPKRLRFFFYKKQSYEPLAVPMVWPVLPDIEWKLALKKMDMELARKIEHAILIVTTGEAPNQYNGGNGINHNNIVRLQQLFTNQTLSRVLVADYTTKAQWTIPDVKEVLGSDKYKIVDQDIREGLQSILTGEDKFANAQIKAKIFIQRLEEGQKRFLEDFLMPEIRAICDAMGFRTVPEVGFQKIDLQDEAIMARIITQLGQIGILTAPEVIRAIETGVLPDKHEMEKNQEEYKKQREKGLYAPLIGGQKDDGEGGANGRPSGSGVKQSTKKVSPIGTSRAAFSTKAYTEHLAASGILEAKVEEAIKKNFGIASLDDSQKLIAKTLVKNIVSIEEKKNWVKSVAKYLKNPKAIPAEVAAEIDDISITYEVDALDAALLRHSKTEAPE